MGLRSDSQDDESAAPPSVPSRRTRDEEESTLDSSEAKSLLSIDSKSTQPNDKLPTSSKSTDNLDGMKEASREEIKTNDSEEDEQEERKLPISSKSTDDPDEMKEASHEEIKTNHSEQDEQEERKLSREELKVKQFEDTANLSGTATATATTSDANSQSTPGAYRSNDSVASAKGLSLMHDSSVADRRLVNDDASYGVSDNSTDRNSKMGAVADHQKEVSPRGNLGAFAVGGKEEQPEEEDARNQTENAFAAGPDMTPIAAAVVSPEKDLEAQAKDIENRLRAEFFQNAVSARVVDSSQGKDGDQEDDERKRKCRFVIIGLILLLVVIGAVVGGVVGATAGRGSSPAIPPAPTLPPAPLLPTGSPTIYVQPCTLCLDGSEPNLEAEVRRGYTCGDLENDLAFLDNPRDEVCLAGQAEGWKSCSCPTLPSKPVSFICSSACRVDSRPPAFDSQECREFEAYVELVGLDASQCDSLIDSTPEACRCSTDIPLLRGILSVVSDERDLLDTSSSQYKAMEWLANRDRANLTLSATPIGVLRMRYLAVLLWESLSGPFWEDQYGFLSAENICDWNDGFSGIRCNDDFSDLTHIIMPSNNLIGNFPGAEISYFSGLQFLRLGGNAITGTIPFSIGALTGLLELDMDNNLGFGGKLPSSLFQLRRLERLWLDNTNLPGPLPDNIGDATSLTSLSILDAGLTGTLPTSISKLTGLKELILTRNKLEGELPKLVNMASIQRFILSDNLFVGTIPAHYAQLRSVERIGVSENLLNGTIPDFSQSNGLQYLFLYDNLFTGNLATLFDNLPSNDLIYLDLDDNQFSGSIPPTIGNFRALDSLFIQLNPFITGTLPTEFGLLTGLSTIIALQSTPFTGAIPTEFGLLTNLVYIDLSISSLTGQIPSELGLMTSLTLLDVNSNRHTGTIPEEFEKLQAMERISFAVTDLNGTVPVGLATAPNLELLLVQETQLTGSLEAFCNAGVETIRADCAFPAEIVCDCCETCL